MARTLKTILNEGNPNKLGAAAQASRLGTLLGVTRYFARLTPVSNVITPPDGARPLNAAAVLQAFAAVGTVTGALTPVSAAPATTEIQVRPNGTLALFATDAVTAVDLEWFAVEGDVVEEVVQVVSNVGTLLQSRAARQLLEVEALTGTVAGPKGVLARGAAATTTNCALNVAATGVAFFAADAVTSARVKYIATPGVGSALPGTAISLIDPSYQF